MTGKTHRGACLCGAVAFEIAGELRGIRACHCQQCRKVTGHYLAATSAPEENFRFSSERGLRWYRSSAMAQRGFCCECGSTLFWRFHREGEAAHDQISVAAGCLEDASALSVVAHIFVADKGAYYEIRDDIPQFPQGDR